HRGRCRPASPSSRRIGAQRKSKIMKYPARKEFIVVGVSGASGAVFARRTLQMLAADSRVEQIQLVISGSGLKVLREELGLDVSKSAAIPSLLAGGRAAKTVYRLDSDNGASIASC